MSLNAQIKSDIKDAMRAKDVQKETHLETFKWLSKTLK